MGQGINSIPYKFSDFQLTCANQTLREMLINIDHEDLLDAHHHMILDRTSKREFAPIFLKEIWILFSPWKKSH